MVTFNLNNSPFSHAYSSTWWKKSKFITWDYRNNSGNYSFYIDGDVDRGIVENNNTKKFLWGLESPNPTLSKKFLEKVKGNLRQVLETYEMIFTYSEELLELDEKFKWCPGGGFWIEEPKIYPKSKLVSFITSNKNFTSQQKLRLDLVSKYKDTIDIYGHGFNRIEKKELGLNDYMFSLSVENAVYDTYFTEKILDCFATGTIPIYSGSKKIVEHFNKDGIIFLEDFKIEDLTPELYYSKMDAIKENFEKVLQFDVLEDWIYKTYLKDIL